MKLLIFSAVSLLIGCVMGCYVGYHYNETFVTNQAVALAVAGGETSDQLQAARSIRVIETLNSGENQRAVQMLSEPIARYYYVYRGSRLDGPDRERWLEIRAMIERLAKSDKVVAAEMTNYLVNIEPGRVTVR